ncbi:uncharacterized protein LOC109194857 isoform X3 [Oreochromis niloticus]|uniref:uncharacterized protein LOC109194857 isoform X3 n=1 Tax=Oreochromis niloticus TaxID=8128 RepID=UPI00090560CE|nr:uncharacterized protein LOC109194857 isoform X3 [Oreochromis niloticus]
MMIEHKLFNISLFLLLLFSGDLSGDLSLSFTVRDGDKVTLPCENVINNHHSCHTTTWLFTDSRGKAAVELVNLGQIKETVKSDRLSVTAECSLVIKKVTAEDVGRYTCRQFRGNPGRQQGPDAVVHLSDVIMTEQKSRDQVTLNCSVQVHGQCEHKVKWIHYSEALNRDYSNIKTLQSSCSATVTFVNSLYSHISNSDFKCNVTTEDDKEQLFTFSPHSSDWSWYRLIIASLGLAALIAAVVIVNIWIRVGEKAQMDENTMCKDEDDDGAVNYENVQSSDEV